MRGQPLIFSDADIVPIHAPTSGYIEDISLCSDSFNNYKKTIKIVILSDHLDKWIRLKPIKNYKKYTSEKLIRIIHQSGIVGLGGGQFPSAKKLMLSINKVHTLIVNAVESEPYITSDNCLINNYIDDIIQGCKIISWISNIKLVLIAIQEDKIESISKIRSCIKKESFFKICIIKKKYPGGSSKVLLKSLTGKEIPEKKHSIDIGYLVFNVATIYSIKRAIINGEPLTERIITLISDTYFLSGNFWMRMGTPINYFLHDKKSRKYFDTEVYFGGLFMGKRIDDKNYSVLKNTNCIWIRLKHDEHKDIVEHSCIRCGFCAHVCPVNLLPQQLYWYSKNSDHKKTKQYYISDCIECHACEKVCPSQIPLVKYFIKEKHIIQKIKLEHDRKKISFLRFQIREQRLLHQKKIFEKDNVNNLKSTIRKEKVQEAIKRIKNKNITNYL